MRYELRATGRKLRVTGRCLAPWAIAAVVCLLAVLPARPAQAQQRWSDPQLARFARVIVTGRVSALTVGRDPVLRDGIYTYVTLEIDEVVKGWVPQREIVIKQLGGRLDGLELVVGDQATFGVGEETLVFLEARPRDGTLYTAALWQGKWDISRDPVSGDALVRRRAPAPLRAGPERPAGRRPGIEPDEEVRLLRPFLAELRSWSGPGALLPPVERVTLRPLETPATVSGGELNGPTGSDFTLLGPARWHEADSGVPVGVQVESGGQPGLAGGGFGEVTTARALWNDAGSELSLSDGGTRSARCFGTFEGDGRLSIAFMDPCAEIDDSGGTLAIGGFYSSYNPADDRTVGGTTFRKILQAMVVNNDSSTALTYLRAPGCLQDILTHEIGHAVGIGHTNAAGNIMQPYIDGGCLSGATRGLGADDLGAVRFIYPVMEPPGVLTGLAPSGTVSDSLPVYQWTPDQGADRYQVQIIETGVRSVYSGIHPAGSVCAGATCALASPPAPQLDPGDYVWRVRALNAIGSGDWSAFVSFSVATARPSAPSLGAPANNVAGTNPSYTWGDVAGAERYQLHIIRVGVGSVYSAVHDAAAICTTGGCTVTSPPAPTLVAGADYVWRVRALASSGSGDWSAFQPFSVSGGPPPAPLLIGPTGTIAGTTPTYSWNVSAGATRYQLHVIEVGVRALYSAVHDAGAVCSGTTCAVASPPVGALTGGKSYVWRVRALNGSGAGEWSPFQSFRVQ